MSEAKFTKGEWSTDGMGIVESGTRIVCDTYMTCKEDLANSNLIAAAPAMYEFLEGIADGALDESDNNELRAILAKARGES